VVLGGWVFLMSEVPLQVVRPVILDKIGGTIERNEAINLFFFFFTLVTGPRRSLSLKMSDTRVCEPQIRARLGTTAHVPALNRAAA